MNKKVNFWINLLETVVFASMVILGTVFYSMNFRTNLLGTNLLITLGFILEILLVSAELFMFHIEKKKYRLWTIAYYGSIVLFLILSNFMVPFYGIFMILIANIVKNAFRINQIEIICDLDQYYEFCDTFHIKVKKARGRRKSTTKISKTKKQTTKKKTVTVTKKKAPAKKKPATPVKKKTTAPAKKTSKSYA